MNQNPRKWILGRRPEQFQVIFWFLLFLFGWKYWIDEGECIGCKLPL